MRSPLKKVVTILVALSLMAIPDSIRAQGNPELLKAKREAETQGKDPTGSLIEKIVEPVPVRLIDPNAVIGTAAHPYSALLWIEHLASPEAQKLIDDNEPGKASVYLPGSINETVLRGKRLSVVEWDSFAKMSQWMKMIVSAWGFPRAEK